MPILVDPTDEVRPDFSLPAHQIARDGLAALFPDDPDPQARATQILETVWDGQHQARVQEWELQQQQPPNPPPPQPEDDQPAPPQRTPTPPPPAPKPTSKAPAFRIDPSIAFPNHKRSRVATYAANRTRNVEFVELYYWTKAGLAEADVAFRSESDDAMGFSLSDGVATLQKVSKASLKAIPDHLLTWEQIMSAKANFLYDIQYRYQWPHEAHQSFSRFYFNLDNHAERDKPFGKDALIRYHAKARHEWFDMIKANGTDGGVFPIDRIDNESLNSLVIEAERHFLIQSRKSFPFVHRKPNISPRLLLFFSSHALLPSTLHAHAHAHVYAHISPHAHAHAHCPPTPTPHRHAHPSSILPHR